MTHIFRTIIILLLILLSSCNNRQKSNNSVPLVDIEANIGKMEVLNLSEFTDNIKYVPLESKDNLPYGYTDDLEISGNLILISDRNVCLLYNIDGHFILKAGNIGRGPGEYPYITNIDLGKAGEIYLSDTEDLYEYRSDGQFINKYIKSILNESYYLSNWVLIGDSLLFGHVPNSTGQEENKALLIDKFGHIKHYYKNYILFERDHRISSTLEDHAHISKFKENVFYKELFNDTLFYLSDQLDLLPVYAFKLEKYKASESARKTLSFEEIFKFIYLYNVFQTENYLFLDLDFGDHFPAKRLTQKKPPASLSGFQFLERYGWHNTRNALGVYDKRSGNLILSNPISTDNPLFTSGLYNDIDAGPRFFPKKQINDSTLVMWVNAEELKNHIASDDFKNCIPKFPEKKRKLEELANKLSIFDNPILMFVTFKK